MQKITPTQMSNRQQVLDYLGFPYDSVPNTTQNQKHDILAAQPVPQGARPSLKAYTIGIGGHTYQTGAGPVPLSQPIDHTSEDFGLYMQIPFVMRPMNNDLTASERLRYALRTVKEGPDGVNYYAYWAKRLDFTGVSVNMTRRTVKNGETTIEPFIPTEKNLSPPTPELPNSAPVTTSGVSLVSSAIVPMPFTEKDVQELYNVAKILYGDERYAVISEFGFLQAIDHNTSITTPEGAVNFRELIAAQVSCHIAGHYELIYNSKGFSFSLEVGAVQPLLATERSTQVTLSLTPNF